MSAGKPRTVTARLVRWFRLLVLLPLAALAAPVSDYHACLGDSLPNHPAGSAVRGSVYALTPPNYCELTLTGLVCYPNGKNQFKFYLWAWRQQCLDDPSKYALLLYESAPSVFSGAASDRTFRPEYLSIEQNGATFDNSTITLSRSPITISPAPISANQSAFTLLVAQNGAAASFDESGAFVIHYDEPGTNDGSPFPVTPFSSGPPDPPPPPLRIALDAAPPSNYTGLWWNPSESGWGINFNHQGDALFATLFTYDSLGKPMWLVMSAGNRQNSSDVFAGDLYQTTGSPFNAKPFVPLGPSNITKVGTMAVAFHGVNRATLTYSYRGLEVTKEIQPQVFDKTGVAFCKSVTTGRSGANAQDLWWNPAESGWGLNIADQGGNYFITLFTYGPDGKGIWYVVPSTHLESGWRKGTMYSTTGAPFNAVPFTGATPTIVGSFEITFTDSDNGVISYCIGASCIQKSVTRQVFGATQPYCTSGTIP